MTNRHHPSRLLLFVSVVLLVCAFGTSAFAQAKIAYLDASKILKKMPEALDAQTRLDALISTWNREADDIANELSRKRTDFDHRKLIMTDAERTATELDLQNLAKRLNDYRDSKYGANGDLYTQQGTLMKPAYDKLMKAIDEAAHDLNYDYVLDRSSRDIAILYSNSKFDLTLIVAKKLGIESDLLTAPLLGGQKPGSNGAPVSTPGMQGVRGGQVPPGQTTPPVMQPTPIDPMSPKH